MQHYYPGRKPRVWQLFHSSVNVIQNALSGMQCLQYMEEFTHTNVDVGYYRIRSFYCTLVVCFFLSVIHIT